VGGPGPSSTNPIYSRIGARLRDTDPSYAKASFRPSSLPFDADAALAALRRPMTISSSHGACSFRTEPDSITAGRELGQRLLGDAFRWKTNRSIVRLLQHLALLWKGPLAFTSNDTGLGTTHVELAPSCHTTCPRGAVISRTKSTPTHPFRRHPKSHQSLQCRHVLEGLGSTCPTRRCSGLGSHCPRAKTSRPSRQLWLLADGTSKPPQHRSSCSQSSYPRSR